MASSFAHCARPTSTGGRPESITWKPLTQWKHENDLQSKGSFTHQHIPYISQKSPGPLCKIITSLAGACMQKCEVQSTTHILDPTAHVWVFHRVIGFHMILYWTKTAFGLDLLKKKIKKYVPGNLACGTESSKKKKNAGIFLSSRVSNWTFFFDWKWVTETFFRKTSGLNTFSHRRRRWLRRKPNPTAANSPSVRQLITSRDQSTVLPAFPDSASQIKLTTAGYNSPLNRTQTWWTSKRAGRQKGENDDDGKEGEQGRPIEAPKGMVRRSTALLSSEKQNREMQRDSDAHEHEQLRFNNNTTGCHQRGAPVLR